MGFGTLEAHVSPRSPFYGGKSAGNEKRLTNMELGTVVTERDIAEAEADPFNPRSGKYHITPMSPLLQSFDHFTSNKEGYGDYVMWVENPVDPSKPEAEKSYTLVKYDPYLEQRQQTERKTEAVKRQVEAGYKVRGGGVAGAEGGGDLLGGTIPVTQIPTLLGG